MQCLRCGSKSSNVVDGQSLNDRVLRLYSCTDCKGKFATMEIRIHGYLGESVETMKQVGSWLRGDHRLIWQKFKAPAAENDGEG